MTIRAGAMSWDHAEQPDVDTLNWLIAHFTYGLRIYNVDDTGSDQYAWVIADGPLTDRQVHDVFHRWWQGLPDHEGETILAVDRP